MVMECHGHGDKPTMLDGRGNEGSWSRTVNVTLMDGHGQSDERTMVDGHVQSDEWTMVDGHGDG